MADYVREAAKAHTSLCLFAAAETILESSDLEFASPARWSRIRGMLRAERQAALERYDRAKFRAERLAPQPKPPESV